MKYFSIFSIVFVFRITGSYIQNSLNILSIFLPHFVDYEYTCADQYKSNQRLKAECLLCLSEQKRRKKQYNGKAIADFNELAIGDYVVHENYGLGIYRGIEMDIMLS